MQHVSTPNRVSKEVLELFPEYPELVVQLFYNRGLTELEQIEHFLDPEYEDMHDPFLFKDMEKACSRVYQAISNNEIIAVYGDYDADGVCAAALLITTLKKLGAQTEVYIPHRDKEGYGLNSDAVDYLNDRKVKLIITCDCGISNVDPVAHANTKGIDVIITDHHDIPEVLPDAFAMIHPKLDRETYPEKLLAGGGVAFKFAQALLQSNESSLSEREAEITEKWLLDFAAISTVADMVLLSGENRVITKYGLIILKNNKRLGFQKLLSAARVDAADVTSETISFQIAPRINAAGRMDHASAAYMLLVSNDEKEADQYAQLIEEQNRTRQRETERIFKEAMEQADSDARCIAVFNAEWPAGLTGLVAGKLVKEFRKPAFVMCDSSGKIVGSGRAPDGISVMDAVRSVSDKLLAFGGHPQACGFRFDTSQLSAVRQALIDYFDTVPEIDSLENVLRQIDANISFRDINWDLVSFIERFAPFGQGNPEPSWYTSKAKIVAAKPVGSKRNHVKFIVEHDGKSIPGIAFNENRKFASGESISLAYKIRVNQWNGNREIQLVIDSIWKEDE